MAVAVKLQDRGMGTLRPGWPQIFGMHPGPTNSGEEQVKTFDAGHLELGRTQLDIRICRLKFGQGTCPIIVEILGSGVAPEIGSQFRQRFVDQRHVWKEEL
jgi:hypothetical protein